jgi:hypothetical protein
MIAVRSQDAGLNPPLPDLIMPFETWLLYFFTCCGIAVVPGPNALLVLTHGALHGSRKTLFTISGGVLGFAMVLTLCALGLGALIQASATWFMALKVAGGPRVGIGPVKPQGLVAVHRVYSAIPRPTQKPHRADRRHCADLRRRRVCR